jgi:hypothetical protein
MSVDPTPSNHDVEPGKVRRRFGSLFGRKDVDSTVPAPGTPPTMDKHGVITDPGNPWIGPVDPKYGYPTEGYSGSQLRTIRRAQQRRSAAEARVASRNHNRGRRTDWQHQADNAQRDRILNGVVQVSPAMWENVNRDQARIEALPSYEQVELKKADQRQAAQDRADDRRAARFLAGQPRGKDLREDIYKEYEALLPLGSPFRRGKKA